jgi:hydrogenase/urease accessory protein HupE
MKFPQPWLRPLIAIVLAHAPVTAVAHPLAPSLLEIREATSGRVEVEWTTPLLQLRGAALRPILPEGCVTEEPPMTRLDEGRVTTRWGASCSFERLNGATLSVDGLSAGKTSVLVRLVGRDGWVVQSLLTPESPELVVANDSRVGVVARYAGLGFRHLLEGLDHVLFVVGLVLLVGERRRLVRAVTAFTLGHSCTLALSVLEVVALPQGPCEIAIAFSLVWMAAELANGEQRNSPLRRHPGRMASTFGLLHGLGFAGALQEAGLPAGEIPLALAAFNTGIEFGQLVVVAVVLGVAALCRLLAEPLPRWLVRSPAYGVGSLAAYWCIERGYALF